MLVRFVVKKKNCMDRNGEAAELVLKYKGECYEDVVSGLEIDGFIMLDQDVWQSIETTGIYKFVLAGYGKETYVSRIEEFCGSEFRLIDVSLSDKKEAIERYEMEHARQRVSAPAAERLRDDFIERIMKDETPFKRLNRINKLRDTKEGHDFFKYIGKDKLELNDLLNVYNPIYGGKTFSVISRKRTDGYLKSFTSPSGTPHYIYPIGKDYKDFLDSVISKKRIMGWFGKEFLDKLENE